MAKQINPIIDGIRKELREHMPKDKHCAWNYDDDEKDWDLWIEDDPILNILINTERIYIHDYASSGGEFDDEFRTFLLPDPNSIQKMIDYVLKIVNKFLSAE